MGLPEILIVFKTKGLTAIQRSERGIVAVILHDDTEGGELLTVYNSITDVDFTKWNERNYEYWGTGLLHGSFCSDRNCLQYCAQ